MLFSLCIFLCLSHVCLLRRPVEAKPVQTQLFTERDLGCARCLLVWRSVLASITINESGKHFLGLFTSIITGDVKAVGGGGGYWRLEMRLGAGVGVSEWLWGGVRAVGESGTPPPPRFKRRDWFLVRVGCR